MTPQFFKTMFSFYKITSQFYKIRASHDKIILLHDKMKSKAYDFTVKLCDGSRRFTKSGLYTTK